MKNKILYSLFLLGFPLFLFGQLVPSFSLSSSDTEENTIEGNCKLLDISVENHPEFFLNKEEKSRFIRDHLF
jgi:hypothetical protein